MSKEISVGGVVFLRDSLGNINYLLIQSRNWKNWAFPKGHIDEGETKEQTAIREIFEETGLKVRILPGFLEHYEYEFDFQGQHIEKEAIFFLTEASGNEIHLSEKEHQNYRWLSFDEAVTLITHPQDKKILLKAHKFLIEHKRRGLFR